MSCRFLRCSYLLRNVRYLQYVYTTRLSLTTGQILADLFLLASGYKGVEFSPGSGIEKGLALDLGCTIHRGSLLGEFDRRKVIPPSDPFLASWSQSGAYHHRIPGLRAFLYRHALSLSSCLVRMPSRSFVELISFLFFELFVATVPLSADSLCPLHGPSPLYLMKRRVLVPLAMSLQQTTSRRSLNAAVTRACVVLST